MNGLTGLMSRYQLPQQHKTVIRRLITSKGKPKAIGEILRDATTTERMIWSLVKIFLEKRLEKEIHF